MRRTSLKLRSRFLTAFLTLGTLPLLVLGLLFLSTFMQAQMDRIHGHLLSVAAIQQARLEAILQQNEERLALVASRTQLRLSLRRYLQDQDPAAQLRMVRILQDAVSSIPDLIQITLYSPQGRVVASTRADRLGQDHFDPELFALSRSTNVVDRLYLDDEGKSRVILTGPVSLDGENLGVIVLRSDVQNLLASLGDYSGLGETGETVLVLPRSPDGYLFLAPTRFNADASLRSVMNGLPPAGGADGFAVHDSLVVTQDYRAQKVLLVSRHVPGTEWLLGVKVDQLEAFAELNRMALFFALILGLLVLLTIGFSVRLAGSLSAPLVRLSGAAKAMAAGNFHQRVPIGSGAEIGVLEDSFNHMSDQVTQAMSEIKTLRGIIPICAGCKKIRDDQGYWQQLESYLTTHSEALFSHGLCPDCLKETEQNIEGL